MPHGQVPISCGISRRAAHHTLGDRTVSHTTTLRSRIQLPILSAAPTCKGWGCPTLQGSARSRDCKNLVPVSPTSVQADRLETRKGSTQRSPRLGEEKHTHSSQRWWHEEGTKHVNTCGSLLEVLSKPCARISMHCAARHTRVCMCKGWGKDAAAPWRDLLGMSLLQALSFPANNDFLTQSWARVELKLSAHVYDKTVDLSELSPTNRWGNWSTRTSHRAAVLMPCS